MEQNLDKVMNDVLQKDGVTGCLFADKLGLCLGAKGNVSSSSSGLIVALVDMANRLEPKSKSSPVISLEGENKQCLIKRSGQITGAIFKNNDVDIE